MIARAVCFEAHGRGSHGAAQTLPENARCVADPSKNVVDGIGLWNLDRKVRARLHPLPRIQPIRDYLQCVGGEADIDLGTVEILRSSLDDDLEIEGAANVHREAGWDQSN